LGYLGVEAGDSFSVDADEEVCDGSEIRIGSGSFVTLAS
jgi:hypothetical protein